MSINQSDFALQFVVFPRARRRDCLAIVVLLIAEPWCRAEVDAPKGALAKWHCGAASLRTRSVPTSAAPQSCVARPSSANDVGILTMTLSVIANSRLRTHLPTIHFVDALEYQKTYCPSEGYKVRLLK